MPFRPDRRRRDDRFLEWKVRLFAVAAVAAMVGIYLDERWMTGTAIVVLALGMALRFLPGGGVARGGGGGGGGGEDAGDGDGEGAGRGEVGESRLADPAGREVDEPGRG